MGSSEEDLSEIQAGIEEELASMGLTDDESTSEPDIETSSEFDSFTEELEKSLERELQEVETSNVQDEIANELEVALAGEGAEATDLDEDPDQINQELRNDLEELETMMDNSDDATDELIVAEEKTEEASAPRGSDKDPLDMGTEEAFDENELAEIMNEIEDIEDMEEPVSSNEGHEPESVDFESNEPEASPEENVVSLHDSSSASTPAAPSMPSDGSFSGGAPVSLGVSGSMDVNLNFKILDKDISVTVDKERGFSLSLDGLNMSVDENNQLTLHLPGGIKFSVPLDDSGSIEKKKVA